MEKFYITYKAVGKGFAETWARVEAKNKTQAIKSLKDRLPFNISIINVTKF